jgi:hypothetical protein
MDTTVQFLDAMHDMRKRSVNRRGEELGYAYTLRVLEYVVGQLADQLEKSGKQDVLEFWTRQLTLYETSEDGRT